MRTVLAPLLLLLLVLAMPSQALNLPFLHRPTCGDGVKTANEQCDDGGTVDGDGCSATCQFTGFENRMGYPGMGSWLWRPLPALLDGSCIEQDLPSQGGGTFHQLDPDGREYGKSRYILLTAEGFVSTGDTPDPRLGKSRLTFSRFYSSSSPPYCVPSSSSALCNNLSVWNRESPDTYNFATCFHPGQPNYVRGLARGDNMRRWIEYINERATYWRGVDAPKPVIGLAWRWDLLTPYEVQISGFEPSFLLPAQSGDFDAFQSWLTSDTSYYCATQTTSGHCIWNDSSPGAAASGGVGGRDSGFRLRDLIDAYGQPNDYKKYIYYLTRPTTADPLTPDAVMADMNNSAYLAWRIDNLRNLLEEIGQPNVMVELPDKVSLHYSGPNGARSGTADYSATGRCPNVTDLLWSSSGGGIGGGSPVFAATPDYTALPHQSACHLLYAQSSTGDVEGRAQTSGGFTSDPYAGGETYEEYVLSIQKVADALIAAGIPYIRPTGGYEWTTGGVYDNAETTTNEDDILKYIALHAAFVVLTPGSTTTQASVSAMAALNAAGIPYIIKDEATVCGDGIVTGQEECDDGNTTSGDGCSAVCAVEIATYACSNGIDDDGDGKTDWSATPSLTDPGCASPTDTSELGGRQCDNGLDDDADGNSDSLDTACANAWDNEEGGDATCGNGLDDDADGPIDYPFDPGCYDSTDTTETYGSAECDDSIDNDADGLVDYLPAVDRDPDCSATSDDYEGHCGDSQISGPEECDDGNTTAGDGCENDCTLSGVVDLTEYTVFDPASTPTAYDQLSGTPQEVGFKFQSDVDGSVIGVKFYKQGGAVPNDGVHIGNLWTSAGANLGTVTFSGETASGWQRMDFAAPIPITAGTTYVASYHYERARAAYTGNAFASEVVRGPLRGLADSVTGGNGVYTNSATSVFPTTNYAEQSWWVDIVFTSNVAKACADGADNDGDGLVDLADAGCTSAADSSEREAGGAACDDGIDNDSDGLADYPLDAGCTSSTDTSELEATGAACDNGVDDDGDGVADYPSDPGCTSVADTSERQVGGAQCDDTVDNDSVNGTDYPADTIGCTGPSDSVEAVPGVGDWPAEDGSDVGINDPQCLALYGKTAAQIEATPCGGTENITAGSTLSACTHNGVFDWQGSNITIDCVNWNTGAAGFGTRCENAAGCSNITIRRTTAVGNNGAGSSQNFIKFSSYTGPVKSGLLEKSDISKSDVLVFVGSGINSDTLTYPGESYALVIRHNRFHHITQVSGAHTDGIYLSEGAKGVLFENNLITAVGTNPAYNWGSMIQDQPTQSGAGNHVFRNNHIITDDTGAALNFDGNPVCAAPVVWDDNKVDLLSPTLFSYTKAEVTCPNIEDRGGISSCSGNTFENDDPQTCSSDGL